MTARFAAVSATIIVTLAAGRPAWSSNIPWRRNVAAAARESATAGKPLLVMVEASWCGPCRRMLQQTFPDPAVAARINAGFVPLLIDVDQQAALVQKLNINAFPTMLVLDSNQRVVERVTGFQSAAQMNARLAALQSLNTRVARRPIEVAQAPRPSPAQSTVRATSFHDRAWASIRAASIQEPRPNLIHNASTIPSAGPPSPGLPPPGLSPRDTFEAARAFSAGR